MKDKMTSHKVYAVWEYMNSTFNGWHYFRKKYSNGMTKEEMEIYSDKESLEEMQKRYERIMWLCAIVLTLNVIMQGSHVVSGRVGLAQSMLLMIYSLGAVVFWFMLWSQKRKQSGFANPVHLGIAFFKILYYNLNETREQ